METVFYYPKDTLRKTVLVKEEKLHDTKAFK